MTDEQRRWAENLLHRYRTVVADDPNWRHDAFGLLRELIEPENHNTIAAAPHYRAWLQSLPEVEESTR
jgi:hypothetical protein